MLDWRTHAFVFVFKGPQEVTVQSPQQLFQLIQDQVGQLFPDATRAAQEELSSHLKSVISGVISRLDLVSRDEFDAQQIVLERTRAKLEALEQAFAELEQRLNQAGSE